MEADVEGLIGAGKHERADHRTTWRNGYRERALDTRLGTLNLKVPKLRQGSYFPGFLEPRKTSEKALVAVIQEAECATMADASFDSAFCLNHSVLKAVLLPSHRAELLDAVVQFRRGYAALVAWEDEKRTGSAGLPVVAGADVGADRREIAGGIPRHFAPKAGPPIGAVPDRLAGSITRSVCE